jgi:hypothetical protein
MTDCFSSPPLNRFGVKRLSSGACFGENIGEFSQTRNPFKRSRNSDQSSSVIHGTEFSPLPKNCDEVIGAFCPTDRESDGIRHRPNFNGAQTININHENGVENRQIDGCRKILRTEFLSSLDQKDAEIFSLRSSMTQQSALLSQTQSGKTVCEEENRILKRAVTIQDGRQKELTYQNQQLQNVLSQAAEHITNLERNNLELRTKLEQARAQHSFSHSNFDNRFPDVF